MLAVIEGDLLPGAAIDGQAAQPREVFAEIQPLRGAYAVTAMPKPEKMGKLYKKLEREGYAFVRLPGEPVKPV